MGSLVSCQLESRLPMLLHQGHDFSSEGDAAVVLGRPSKYPLAI